MKLYIIQTYDPEDKEYLMEVMSEKRYNEWITYAKRREIDKFIEVIKVVELTSEEANKIKADIFAEDTDDRPQ